MNKFYRWDCAQKPTTKATFDFKSMTATKGTQTGTILGKTNKFIAVKWDNCTTTEIFSMGARTYNA